MEFEPTSYTTGTTGLSKDKIELYLKLLLLNSSTKNEVINVSKNDIINLNSKTDIIFTSSAVNENLYNKKRTLQLEKDFTNKLLYYLKEDEFEYGFENRVDILVKDQMSINSLATKEWLNKIYINNFNNPEILIGILRLIARINIDIISPEGKIMAIASLSHKNMEVKECGIRAFESWCTLDSLDILKNVNVQPKWLQDYLKQVIDNIEKEHAIISEEDN